MMIDRAIHSDLPIPPGEFLEEVLEDLGIPKVELAHRMDRPAAKLSAIFKGKKAITPDTALQLEKVVGVPAHIWTSLESQYRLALARQQEVLEAERLRDETPLVKCFCYSTLAKLGVVPRYPKKTDRVLALQKFFGVTSLFNVGELQRYEPAFRCGKLKNERLPEAVASWLRLGEIKAREIECAVFDKKRLQAALSEIRCMTKRPPDEFLPRLTGIMAKAGVALVFIPHFPKTYAHGATFPLGRDKAVVMLSIRGRWADIFWFSFFHEAGHILLHDRNKIFVECEDDDPQIQTQEAEADKFAADTLIPPDKWSAFIKERSFFSADIHFFAKDIEINPGIVIGRLQHEGFLKPSWRNELRTRYEWKNSL